MNLEAYFSGDGSTWGGSKAGDNAASAKVVVRGSGVGAMWLPAELLESALLLFP